MERAFAERKGRDDQPHRQEFALAAGRFADASSEAPALSRRSATPGGVAARERKSTAQAQTRPRPLRHPRRFPRPLLRLRAQRLSRLRREGEAAGIVDIGVNNVQELLVAADMLQLTEVVNLCCAFLKGQIDPLNCIGIFQFSEQIACHDLLEFTENYIHVHFLEVQSGEEFLALTKDQLIKILRSEELSIEDEYQVFLAAMQWLLKDLGKRKKYVVEVLDPIRFPLLPPQRLLKYIEGVSDFNLRVALQTLLKEYCEVCKSPKENKFCSFLQTSKVRPRKKARKYLYAVGGYTRLQGGRWSDSRALSCVERFDTFSQYWTTVSSLHQARCGLGVAVLGGMVYAIGGEKDSMIFDCTECYDPVTKQWTTVASMNHPRCGLGVCVCYGAIYALGGWVGAEIGNTIERFDPDENKWEVVGNMAMSRYYFGCCEMQGD
uniref:Actin-binding protein IPP n=1 Tax=Myotis myotis TaxID=51298 RepID=A0A7J7ZWI3_MYOMY|nr:intracisternal A particle-promoted polypeptide [Myotis myotis]